MQWTCYLSLGANLGAKGETLREALRLLAVLPDTQLLRASSFYTTAPWGKTDQPDFLNAACALRTSLTPLELLHECQDIEVQLGRIRHERWGARTCDIDLVYASDGITSDTAELRLPHPYLTERAFVLVPLAEIAPELVIKGRTVTAWRDSVAHQDYQLALEVCDPYPLHLIACMGMDRGIGKEGQLLFDEPEDKAFFREKTTGGILIMGRHTLATLPDEQPLPRRLNIVLSRTLTGKAQAAKERAGFVICHDLTELWQTLGQLQSEENWRQRKVWVIGGAAIYRLLLPYCRDAWLTEVAANVPADAYLPELTGMTLQEEIASQLSPTLSFCYYRRTAASSYGD